MSELLALGISHKTTPVALRERLAFTEAQAVEFAGDLARTPEVSEAVVISTCNRTEVYLVVGDPVRAETDVLGMLARRAGIRPTELAQEIYSPGVDDRRRGGDPGAGEARPRSGDARRRHRPPLKQAVRGGAHHR
jgi:glutamyl-tRNA reductase